MHEHFKKAFDFLLSKNIYAIEKGKYSIDKKMVYASVNNYITTPKEQGVWEAHKKYIDIHFICSGTELLGYNNIKNLTPTSDYNATKDIMFLSGNGEYITLEKGEFAIFYPEDAHIPGLAVNEPQNVKKIVIKIEA